MTMPLHVQDGDVVAARRRKQLLGAFLQRAVGERGDRRAEAVGAVGMHDETIQGCHDPARNLQRALQTPRGRPAVAVIARYSQRLAIARLAKDLRGHIAHPAEEELSLRHSLSVIWRTGAGIVARRARDRIGRSDAIDAPRKEYRFAAKHVAQILKHLPHERVGRRSDGEAA